MIKSIKIGSQRSVMPNSGTLYFFYSKVVFSYLMIAQPASMKEDSLFLRQQ